MTYFAFRTRFALLRRIASLVAVAAAPLVASSAIGCGGSSRVGDAGDASASAFPIGAYDNCSVTTFLEVPGGGGLSGNGGSATVAQSGSVLSVSYGGDGGLLATSLEFTQTSTTSAALRAGQKLSGIQVPCAPLKNAPTVTELASGSLTYNAGTLFLSVEGTAGAVEAGAGCSNPGGKASVVITCGDDGAGTPGGGIDAGSNEAALGSDFVGAYSCLSSVVSSGDGVESTAGTGAAAVMGALTITETGGVLTAAYANDLFVEGSLDFVETTPGAAVPAPGSQTMQVYRLGAGNTANGDPALQSLPVKASTLTVDGSWVVLSFVGSMEAGSETAVSLLCYGSQG